jgi:SHS2 domain-containing protein
MEPAAHAFEEHTGEVRLRVEADDLAALFIEAGRALGELMGGAEPPQASAPREPVELRARDRAALLVAWLDELIFFTEKTGLIYDQLEIQKIDDQQLLATIRGGRMTEPRVPVKAATLHQLRIEEHDGRLSARVVLDV